MTEQKLPVPMGPTGAIWRSLLPERTVEDVLTGVLRMQFGQTEFKVPLLVIEKADEWRESLQREFINVMGALEGQTNAAGVLAFMGAHTPTMLRLIHEYDVADVLPDDDWIRGHANEPEILRAFMLLLAASFPFIAAALDILAANPGALKIVLEEFGPAQPPIPAGSPTSTSPGPTAGRSGKSARRSRTSSSRAT
jgi:hypothetical protein